MIRVRLSHGLFLLALCSGSMVQASSLAQSPQSEHSEPSGEGPTSPQNDDTSSETATLALRDGQVLAIKIGQPTTLHLHAQLPEHAQLVSVRPAGNRFVEAIDSITAVDPHKPRLELTVFRPGDYRFRVEAIWVDAGGAQHSTLSEWLTIEVASSLSANADDALLPPGPYLSLRSRNLWLMGATIGAALMALVWLLSLLWKRRHATVADDVMAPPPRPAWEVALEEIRALRDNEQLLTEQPILFHHRISEILRTWIQGRFKIGAPEMTSEEILDEIRPRRLVLGGWIDRIESILADSDMVKFAKFSPPTKNSLLLLDQLELLVREVKESDESPTPDIPLPIDLEEPPIAHSKAAAPQIHAPGEAEPKYTPEHAPSPRIISMRFRGDAATPDASQDATNAPAPPSKPAAPRNDVHILFPRDEQEDDV